MNPGRFQNNLEKCLFFDHAALEAAANEHNVIDFQCDWLNMLNLCRWHPSTS